MMASVGIMVGSFRETVIVWLDTQLRADLYVRPAATRRRGPVSRALRARSPDAGRSRPRRRSRGRLPRHGIPLSGRARHARRGRHRDRAPLRPAALSARARIATPSCARCPGQDRAIVSEPFANKHSVRAGDRLDLPLGDRTVAVTVAGIYYDYSSSQGCVILDRSTLLQISARPAAHQPRHLPAARRRCAAPCATSLKRAWRPIAS